MKAFLDFLDFDFSIKIAHYQKSHSEQFEDRIISNLVKQKPQTLKQNIITSLKSTKDYDWVSFTHPVNDSIFIQYINEKDWIVFDFPYNSLNGNYNKLHRLDYLIHFYKIPKRRRNHYRQSTTNVISLQFKKSEIDKAATFGIHTLKEVHRVKTNLPYILAVASQKDT